MRWSNARGDKLPEDIRTMPKEMPPEIDKESLHDFSKQH